MIGGLWVCCGGCGCFWVFFLVGGGVGGKTEKDKQRAKARVIGRNGQRERKREIERERQHRVGFSELIRIDSLLGVVQLVSSWQTKCSSARSQSPETM